MLMRTQMFSCAGPHIFLSQNMINFHQVDAGATGTSHVDVINDSDTDASIHVSQLIIYRLLYTSRNVHTV